MIMDTAFNNNRRRALIKALLTLFGGKYATVVRHSIRVADIAMRISARLDMSECIRDTLWYGCMLHDIGYLSIEQDIIKVKRALALHEKVKMRRHVKQGYDMVSRYIRSTGVLDVILFHHEHIDGSGYPFGLEEMSIPLAARIAAVADTLEALMSPRPHRPAYVLADAKRKLLAISGSQLDRYAVRACMEADLDTVISPAA